MKHSRLVLTALFVAALAGCSRSPGPAAADTGTPQPVRVAQVSSAERPIYVELTGTVRPVERAVLAAKVVGTIGDLPITLGKRVAAGELLARINALEIGARVAQAQAGLTQARRELERERGLLGKGASTADLVHSFEERLAAAEAQMHEAEVMRGYTEIRAPFAGIVAHKFVTVGDLATAGQPLLEIEGLSDFEIELGVPDSLVASLPAAAALQVRSSSGDLLCEATAREISSASDVQARTVTAKLAVPASAQVRSGQFVRVQVPGGAAKVLRVPSSAVSVLGQLERVFVVQEGRVVMRIVRTGAVRDGLVEVSAGLDGNERVVLDASQSLRDGAKVEVLR